MADLFLERDQALLHALAPFHHKADFGLQTPHVRAGFVQQALGLIHLVACGVMRLAHGFQLGLNMAQIGHAGLERVDCGQSVGLHLGLVGQCFGTLEEPLLVLLLRHFGLQRVVLLGHLGLLFELLEVGVELAQDVFHPRQVLARVRQAVFGLAAAFLVFGNAGGFFEEQAQLFRLGFDDATDGALADDGVGAWA